MKKQVFIERARIKHGNFFDYSLVDEEITKSAKINIICPNHGIFKQRYDAHLSGQGCGRCKNSILSNTEDFVKKGDEKHNNYYDYTCVDYVNSKTKVKIICPQHGIFFQTPDSHLCGHGCTICATEKNGGGKIKTAKETFHDKAYKIHGLKYGYKKSAYSQAREKIIITCDKHGDFSQTPNDHLSGRGCLYCSMQETKPELEIKKFLTENAIKFIENDRKILNGREIDIFIPEHNLGIEYNGLYWHCDLFKEKAYHRNKTDLAVKNDVHLIQIFEDEWINKENIVKSIIKSKIGLYQHKIYARKCSVDFIDDNKIVRTFLNENHIQGFVGSKIKIGLYYQGELVSLMTFGKKRRSLGDKSKSDGEYEMLRYCNKINTTVVGGAGKLFNFFLKNLNPNKVITYADKRYFSGDLYRQLGFKFIGHTKPNYFYFKKRELVREHRYKYRKDVLVRQGFSSNQTEEEIMRKRKYLKIFDAGHMKFEYSL
jgi:hypothetical protein